MVIENNGQFYIIESDYVIRNKLLAFESVVYNLLSFVLERTSIATWYVF